MTPWGPTPGQSFLLTRIPRTYRAWRVLVWLPGAVWRGFKAFLLILVALFILGHLFGWWA